MNSAPVFHRRFQFWLLAGIVTVAAAFPLDDAVDGALVLAGDSAWKNLAWWCSKIGEGWVPAAAGIFFAVIFFWRRQPVVAAKIFFVVLTCEVTGLVATILRLAFGRARPCNHAVPPGFYGVWHDGHWIIGKFQFSSFPSGHTATAVGLLAAAWLVNRRWGAVAVIYAVAVAWSRIALECHHFSDVLASTVLSIAGAVLMKKYYAPVNDRWFTRFASRRK